MREIVLCAGFLVLLQLIKSLIDVYHARSLIKALKKRDELHAKEWEIVMFRFHEIMESFLVLEKKIETMDMNIHALQDDVFDVVIRNSGVKKTRGPYKPRKPKEIGHKKTPPEN